MKLERGEPGASRIARHPGGWGSVTMVVCDTVLLLACLGSVVWLVVAGRPTAEVLGVVWPIVVAVLAREYGHGAADGLQHGLRTLGRNRQAPSR